MSRGTFGRPSSKPAERVVPRVLEKLLLAESVDLRGEGSSCQEQAEPAQGGHGRNSIRCGRRRMGTIHGNCAQQATGRVQLFGFEMGKEFHVGIDPGWADAFESYMGRFARSFFENGSNVRWEVMNDLHDPGRGRAARPEVVDRYDGVIILGTRFDHASFEGVERLVCIARWGVGFDAIDIPSANAAGVLVALTPDAIARAVAEAQIALVLALAKRVPDLDRRTRAGQWRTDMPILGTDVIGKTISSVGCGRIGAEMFSMARGLGFGRCLAYDPYCPKDRASAIGVELVDLETVMAEGDFVTVNALLNSETRGLVGRGSLP